MQRVVELVLRTVLDKVDLPCLTVPFCAVASLGGDPWTGSNLGGEAPLICGHGCDLKNDEPHLSSFSRITCGSFLGSGVIFRR